MVNVVLTATPLVGHVNPMLGLGRGLRERGHRVTVLTGCGFAATVRAHGLQFAPLPPTTDIAPTRRSSRRPRVLAGRDEILATFVRPLADQYQALHGLLATGGFDVVLSDTAFLGALPLAAQPRGSRVPVLGVSMTPLSLISIDSAPFGAAMPPGSSWFTRQRNLQINWLLYNGPLKAVQEQLDAALHSHGVPAGTYNYFDQVRAFDRAFQLGAPGMEYPRRETPSTLHFVGPIPPSAPQAPLPHWWSDLDGHRPVVHVTQGTMDNDDAAKLLVPAIQAMADEDVLVVVSTGGRPTEEIRRRLRTVPANLRLETFLPYGSLLPRVTVMVTNGGYGGMHEALRYGIPLVVAGDTEDKPEVAARVAWAGVGRNLRTGHPSARRIRSAVCTVLHDPRYREAAARVQREIAALGDPVAAIAAMVEQVAHGPMKTGQPVPHLSSSKATTG